MYSSAFIKNLNNDIKKHFSHLTPVQKTDKMKLSGVPRLVMLDRYAQKDITLKTLKVGDIVVVMVKENKWFPVRAIGEITKINYNTKTAQVKIATDYKNTLESGMVIPGTEAEVMRPFRAIEKPMEVYYEQIASRVAGNLAAQENSMMKINHWNEKFYEEIKNQRIVPAGRVLYGAGSESKVTFFNCFVMPMIHDSREGISFHRQEVMEIMSHGGGVGSNGSTLRPRGALAKGVNGKSSGAVSWLNDLSSLTNLVEQGGSRRGAQMIMMADWHPDIIEFIIAKMQKPAILVWLKKNSKHPRIQEEIDRKLKFEALSVADQKKYQQIVDNAKLFDEAIVAHAREQLQNGGTWSVMNPDFLTGANISVLISDDFMHAVERKDTWYFRYPDLDAYNAEEKRQYDEEWSKIGDVREWEQKGFRIKTYDSIPAQELWDLINFCANYSAEPGIFFIDRANAMTNAKTYGMKVVATNPCGEQPLAPYSVCNLAAINLSKFVNRQTKTILWKELETSVSTCVRMQDNVIDATYYFSKKNRDQALGERRVGLGVMGLHDLLIWSGYRYGSDRANQVVDRLFHLIARTSYLTSSAIAKEKGSFPFLISNEKFLTSGYMQKMDEDVRIAIAENGIRNSHLLTIAPTGSTGTMANVSTGLEPYFAFKYYRSGRLGKFMEVNAPIVNEWLQLNSRHKENELPDIFVAAQDLTPMEHAKVQCVIQRWIDSSISKTVNAPAGYTVRQVQQIYETLFKLGAKGGTVYVDGSRETQVLSLTKEETFNQEAIAQVAATEPTVQEPGEIASLRGLNQDRNIGTNIGDVCAYCSEGTMIEAGGCSTCSNCNMQWKCEV